MRVKYKPTGQLGTIPDNEFDPSIYDQINLPVQTSNSLLGNVAKSKPVNGSELPQNMSFGGLINNASRDVGNIAKGVLQLPGMAAKFFPPAMVYDVVTGKSTPEKQFKDQRDTLLGLGKGVVGSYNDLVGRPLEGGDFIGRAVGNAYNKPVTTALNVYGAAKAVGGVKNLLTKPKAAQITPTADQVPVEAQVVPSQMAQIDRAVATPQTTLATKSFLSPFTIPTKIAKYMKPHEVAKYFVDHNVSGSLDDLEGLTKTVTGGTGKITQLTDELANSAAPVEIGTNLLSKAQKAELTRVYINELPSLQGGVLSATEALKLQRILEELGHQYMRAGTNYLTPNVRAEQIGTAYLNSAGKVGDLLDDVTVDPSALASIKTAENVQYLNGVVSGLGDDLLKVNNLAGLRSLAAPYVKLGQMVEQTLASSQSAFNKLAGNLGSVIPSIADPLAPVKAGINYMQNTPQVRTGAASVISNIAKTGGNVASTATRGAQTFGDIMGKVGVAGSLTQPAIQPQDELPVATQPTSNSLISSLAGSNQQTTEPAQTQKASPFSLDQLDQGYFNALQSGDTEAASQIKAMADYQRNIEKTAKPQTINPVSLTGEDSLNSIEQALGLRDQDGNPIPNATVDKSQFIKERFTPGTGTLNSSMYAAARNYLNLTSKYPPTPDKIQSTIDNLFPSYWVDDTENIRRIAALRNAFKQFYYTKPTDETLVPEEAGF